MNQQASAGLRRRFSLSLLLHVGLGLLMGIVTCLWAGQTARLTAASSLDDRLRAAGASANAGLIEVQRRQLALVRAVEFTQNLADRFAEGNLTAVRDLAEPLQGNSYVPMLDLLDTGGRVRLGFHSPGLPPPAAGTLDWPVVNQVLAGATEAGEERISALVLERGQLPVITTAGPLRSGGRIVGVAVASTPLTDVLAELANLSQVGLTVYDGSGNPLASTLPGAPADLAADRARAVLDGQAPAVPRLFLLGGRAQREVLGRLVIDHHGAAILGASLADVPASIARVLWIQVGAGLVATALTMFSLGVRATSGSAS